MLLPRKVFLTYLKDFNGTQQRSKSPSPSKLSLSLAFPSLSALLPHTTVLGASVTPRVKYAPLSIKTSRLFEQFVPKA